SPSNSLFRQPRQLVPGILLACLLAGSNLAAQSESNPMEDYSPVSDQMLANPSHEDWLMWRGSYDLSGHSELSQINRSNVADLELAWSMPLSQGGNMTTPLVHDGVLFIADTNNILRAVDASNGTQLWQYQHESENFDGRRIGVAIHGNQLIVPHNDMDLVALDATSGEVLWELAIETPPNPEQRGYHSLRGAPLIAGNTVVQGIGATVTPEGGFIIGVDLETGKEKWRFQTVARPDGIGGNTWNNLALEDRSGGSVWISGSYDPELDLVYFGTAPTYDTAPLLDELGIDGVNNDALFTNTTLALRPETGELVWFYQHMRNDQWDLDWVYERQLAEVSIDGEPRKVVFTAGKMALYDVLDASTGQYLNSVDVGFQNMITSIDPETGNKTRHPNTIPNAELSAVLCPSFLGGRNWQSAAYNDNRKMTYLPMSEMCMNFGPIGEGTLLTTGVEFSFASRPDSDGNYGRIQAIDMTTMELAWSSRQLTPPSTAILSTGGDLLFAGFLDQTFQAIDNETGAILWQTDLQHLPSSFPISFAVDGKQYVAIVRGQPSRWIGSLYGTVNEFLEDQGGLPVPTAEPALMVFALP
ncbi:MAG: PQQ-binding-like beta-propeller repeat protein, partial [Pseudomonadales bacterium]|nr:PQQ-binding-like beta-propeller repeat protein [Pseudomonadales bacterium]